MSRGVRTNGRNYVDDLMGAIPDFKVLQEKIAGYPKHEHLKPIGAYPVVDPALGIAAGLILETDLTDREMNTPPMFESLHAYIQELRTVAEPDGFVGCTITGLGGRINE